MAGPCMGGDPRSLDCLWQAAAVGQGSYQTMAVRRGRTGRKEERGKDGSHVGDSEEAVMRHGRCLKRYAILKRRET